MADGWILRRRFGERIETLASRSGFSADELARRTNLAPRRLREVLSGGAPHVTLREMSVLAEAVATPLPDLLAPADDHDHGDRGS